MRDILNIIVAWTVLSCITLSVGYAQMYEPVITPEVKQYVSPAYPAELIGSGIVGAVRIQVTIDEKGNVIHATSLGKTNHPQLEGAALEAVRKWKYDPQVVKGKPVQAKFNTIVEWSEQVDHERWNFLLRKNEES